MSTYNARQNRLRIYWIPIILLIPGLICALGLGAKRHSVESRNKAVELAVDYSEMQTLSVSSGKPIPLLLTQFKHSGITSVAISEELLGDLVTTGQATYTQQASDLGPLTVIHISNKRLEGRVLRALSVRLAPGMVTPNLASLKQGEIPETFVVRAAPTTLNGIGIGLPPDAVQIVKRADLGVVARLQNHPALTKEAVRAEIDDLHRDGIRILISSGEEVFGFKGLIPYAAETIKSSGLIFGSIEFAKQKGDARICKALGADFIRVHSVTYAEMAEMAPATAVERFERAVKERGIRLCYVRLPQTSGQDPVKEDLGFVSSIRNHIEGSGYKVGTAHLFGELHRPKLFMALMALSVAAGLVLLIGSLVSLSSAGMFGLLISGAVVFAGLSVAGEKGAQLLALASALIFPTLGVTAIVGPYFKGENHEKRPLLKASIMFIAASIITLCGALLVVGLLADRSYMVKVNQFMGIKAAHILPLLVVGLAIVGGLPIFNQPFSKVRTKVVDSYRRMADNPLFVWHVIAVVFAVGVVGFALLRTGNDSGLGVSPLELKFRALLDHIMVVRPRTKEFLIGHPAMFLGIMLLLKRRRAWGLPLVVLGVLGQASLLNTFCHIHTPLSISVLRAFNGLWVGLFLGVAIWWLFVRERHARKKA